MASTDSQAANKTWELSLYELNRSPQEVITDSTEIAVSPRSLHSELMCPICLDMLKNTMTTKECLHRFCQECIITALRSGNKECPTCRKKLVSKRSLRPDPNFDMLISKIYPSRDEYEAHQERVLQKLKGNHNPTALAHSIEEGLRLQAMSRTVRLRKNNANEDPTSAPATPSRGTTPTPGSSTEAITAAPGGVVHIGGTVVGTPGVINVPAVSGAAIPAAPSVPAAPPAGPVAGGPGPQQHPQPQQQQQAQGQQGPGPGSGPTLQKERDGAGSRERDRDRDGSIPRKRPKSGGGGVGAWPDEPGSGTEAGGPQEAPGDESVGEGESVTGETTTVNEIELVFKPHPEDDDRPPVADTHIRYIKTTANATVDHLSKYLVMRLALDMKSEDPSNDTVPPADNLQFTIYIASTPGQFTVLGGNMTLDQVNEKYWKVNKPLEMYYSPKK